MSAPVKPQHARTLGWIGTVALIGVGAFAVLAWRTITVEQAVPEEAVQRFVGIRARLMCEPILQVDAHGVVARRHPPSASNASALATFHVLAYRNQERRLVRSDIPFWFVKLKGSGVEYFLRGTGLDLLRLGVTPAELEKYGPCVVLDETRQNGDRLLVWTD